MQRLRTVTSLDVSAVAGHHAMPAALLSVYVIELELLSRDNLSSQVNFFDKLTKNPNLEKEKKILILCVCVWGGGGRRGEGGEGGDCK